MDIARLGLAVDSSQVEKGTVTLRQLTGAAGQASAAAQRLAGATTAEAAGHKAAAAAAQVHNAALMAQNTVIRSSMQQRTMMIYQLNDVVVSLASGMNPAMVAMQQGSQILQGGFAPALQTITDLAKGFLVTFWPVAAAVGAVTLAVAGLSYEINKTAEVQVGFFDVALAGWQLFAEGVTGIVAPLFGQIGAWLQQGWDIAAPILKAIGNTIIGAFSFAIQAIGSLWNGLPAAVGDAIIKVANIVISGLEYTINKASEFINGFIGKYNEGLSAMGQKTLPTFSGVQIPRAANPYEGAMGALGTDIGANASSAFGTDYMGDAFGALSQRAQQIAAARQEVEGVGSAANTANDNVKNLADDGMASLGDRAKDVAASIKEFAQGLGSSIWQNIRQGGNVIEGILDSISKKLDDIIGKLLDDVINQGLSALFGGFGSFGIGSGLAGTSSITGSSGGFFPAFDGGGYTGSGPRSGGLDGKGGFLAMMHPRETVTDHTKAANQNQAQPAAYNDNRVYNIDAKGAQVGVAEQIMAAIKQYDRTQAPQTAVNAVQQNQQRNG